VVELYAAGIPLMVGTDLCTPGSLPGFSVHDEMEIWQDAGIPAADVLRSATLVPARFIGLDNRLGTIVAGKTASMVLLRANPLGDVRNAREIEAVFLRGTYYDRAGLDRLLAEARDLAKR
jgi:imidazolonepropionase-like amidohydrolase